MERIAGAGITPAHAPATMGWLCGTGKPRDAECGRGGRTMGGTEQDLLKEIAGHLRGLREIADVIKAELEAALELLRAIDEKTPPAPPPGH